MHSSLKSCCLLASALTVAVIASAQPAKLSWQMQESGTTASLRGIYTVDGEVAWASGTEGTVLRTTDGGLHWTKCAVPDAEKDGATLDFRGVQSWDAQTAIIMASGPGEKSRLYKTLDGCKSWMLTMKNTDPDGFYDAVAFWDDQHGLLFGDPVHKMPTAFGDGDKIATMSSMNFYSPRFLVLATNDGGANWCYWSVEHSRPPNPGLIGGSAFAASNSSIFLRKEVSWDTSQHEYKTVRAWAGVGGKGGARIFLGFAVDADAAPSKIEWSRAIKVPLRSGTDSSGVFSVSFRAERNSNPKIDFTGELYHRGVAVGGDYTKPNESTGTAAWTTDGGQHWTASTTPPHGYRSSVAWSEDLKAWITAGTNGSDISRDDGKTWTPFPNDETANGNWNALSLPFVVGPHGRIARLSIPDSARTTKAPK